MRAKIIMFASLAIGGSLCMHAGGAADLASTLAGIDRYAADATFEVLLPSAREPVTYSVHLQSEAAPSDTLSPCKYLIVWETEAQNGTLSGFSAYYDGNQYVYRNNRLQEYHADASVMPFMPLGPGTAYQGVQSTTQFADLLPQYLGDKLARMAADSTYLYKVHTDTIVSGKRCIAVDGVKRGNGYDVMEYIYTFDPATGYPLYTEIQSSPGSISEQIMTVTYSPPTDRPTEISEEGLMERWPEVFEKYRQSTFKAENLAGTPLPQFSCRVFGGTDRVTHHTGDGFDAPSVFVFIDPDVSSTAATVAAVREAVGMAPMDCRVYWVFTTNVDEDIASATGDVRGGEQSLVSANSLVRNCGVTMYPTILTVGRDGTVRDVMPGYNADLAMLLLQKLMLVK